jgi:hypothetical protein
MKILNKDIQGVILSYLGINEMKKLMISTKCSTLLKAIVIYCNNKQIYTLHDQSLNVILKSNITRTTYNIPIPKNIKKAFYDEFNWIECLTEGVYVINQKSRIFYINTNNKSCSILQYNKMLDYSVNRETSTLCLYYYNSKLSDNCLKVYNSEGKEESYIPNFKYSIKEMIYGDNFLYYIDKGESKLICFDLKNNTSECLYERVGLYGIYLKEKHLLTIAYKTVILCDTTRRTNIQLINLDVIPVVLCPLSKKTFLALDEDGKSYQLNLDTRDFQKLCFELDNGLKLSYGTRSAIYSKEGLKYFIIMFGRLYYIIRKNDLSCIFKGYCDLKRNYCLDWGKKLALNFAHSKVNGNLVFKIDEYELVDNTKVINVGNLLDKKPAWVNSYQLPSSKNFIVKVNDVKSVYYYFNYSKNTIEELFESEGSGAMVPLTNYSMCYFKEGEVVKYNYLNETKTVLFKTSNIYGIEKLNNFLVINRRENCIDIYDLKLRDFVLSGKHALRRFRDQIYFDKLLYIHSFEGDVIYTTQNGKLEKLWSETSAYVSGIYSDKDFMYVFTSKSEMVCFDRESKITVKALNATNIESTNLDTDVKEELLLLTKWW